MQPPDELEGQGHKPGEEQGGRALRKNMCPSQAIRLWQIMPSHRRFPAPWSAEEYNDVCYIVRDHDGQALACVYYEEESGRRSAAKLLAHCEYLNIRD